MPDEEDTDESTDIEDAADDLREKAEQAVEQANGFHGQVDQMKEWSVNTAGNIAGRAETLHELGVLDEDEAQELMQKAQRIRTVYQRIT